MWQIRHQHTFAGCVVMPTQCKFIIHHIMAVPPINPAFPLIRRRRRKHWPVIATLAVVAMAVMLILRMLDQRGRGDEQNDEVNASLERALARLSTPETKDEKKKADPPKSEKTAAGPARIPKALSAEKAREEFSRAAEVLRRYFQSPNEDTLAAILRHPDESLPRHREWSLRHHLVPAVPLRIGPQFGMQDSLLVTSIKMADGTSRLAALEKTAAGYRLDWESLSAWGECRFNEIMTLSPDQTVVLRVTARPSSATAPKADAHSFTLSNPDERSTLAAYASSAVLARSRASRLFQSANGGMFTLRLAAAPAGLGGGWACIHEVISAGWVPDAPQD